MNNSIRIPVGPSGKPVAWATIDFEDYERVVAYRWYRNPRGYAFTPYDKGKSMFLHGYVVNRLRESDSLDVDHINRDKLDCRRANLRVVSHRDNCLNSLRAEGWEGDRLRARELRLDGWLLGAIAEELGIAYLTASRYCRGLTGPAHPNLVWTRDAIAEAFTAFQAQHGRAPKQSDLDGEKMPWFTTIYRAFPGGLGEAREYAGLPRGKVSGRKYARRAAA